MHVKDKIRPHEKKQILYIKFNVKIATVNI